MTTGADLDGSPLPSSTSAYQYDGFGNATQITVTNADGFSKVTTNSYANDTVNWLLGRLAGATVISQAPSVAQQSTGPDATPGPFNFAPILNALPSTSYETSAGLSGFNQPVTAQVSGGDAQIRKNGAGGWGSSISIFPGETLNLRMTSGPVSGTVVTATVTMGSVSVDWSITTKRQITISSNVNDFNLRTAHDSLYPAPTGSPVTVHCIIEASAIVGSTNIATPAFNVGTWPAGVSIIVEVRGRLQGRGGKGGAAALTVGGGGGNGENGGAALYARSAINLIVTDGNAKIWGGGGGGGGGRITSSGKHAGGGGGGAGQLPGNGGNTGNGAGNAGQPGTTEAGGMGAGPGTSQARGGGAGGNPGQIGVEAGPLGPDGDGGGAGPAIDGLTFVTKTGSGDIRGPQIN